MTFITKWEPVQLRQEWAISNMDKAMSLCTPGVVLRSNTFTSVEMPGISWSICLYPGGKREENSGNVSIFLKMNTNVIQESFTIKAEYRFFFVDEQGVPRFRNINIGEFKMRAPRGSHSWGLRNIPKSKVEQCLCADNSLRIYCQIDLVPDFNQIPAEPMYNLDFEAKTEKLTETSKDFLERLHAMYKSEVCTDFLIECDDELFKVHKLALAAHSDAFRTMLTCEQATEAHEGRVRLHGFTPATVRQMIDYMYLGELPVDFADEDALSLIDIAQKYGLDDLKLKCEKKLGSRLTKENVIPMLVLADAHNAETLKEACVPVIRDSVNEILNSSDWDMLKETNVQLVNYTLETMLKVSQTQSFAIFQHPIDPPMQLH